MLGIADADSAEHTPESRHHIITPVYCALPRGPNDPPALHDEHPIRLLAGSRLRAICGADMINEGFFCNYEVNPDYVPQLEAAGLRICGIGPEGEVRAMELPDHVFYIPTLFHPAVRSKPGQPHPFIAAFVQAAQARARSASA